MDSWFDGKPDSYNYYHGWSEDRFWEMYDELNEEPTTAQLVAEAIAASRARREGALPVGA